MNNAYLILEDGSVYEGQGFGHKTTISGEVVFNTGMVGYTESLTDPSYRGQILCQTYPLIGNYGVNKEDAESDRIQVSGYIISELCKNPNHFTMGQALNEFLIGNNTPGISGIDTRELTKKLRIKGVMLGAISNDGTKISELEKMAKNIPDPNETDLVKKVTIKKPIFYGSGRSKTIAVIDCGVKMNIIRSLIERNANVIRVPANYDFDKIMCYKPEGVLISNGPGDPKKAEYVIETTKKLVEYKMPVFGICLGIQILALAFGGNTYKLKFGHRAQNHPVMHKNGKCFITSQNHGYSVDANSLPKDLEVTFLNINDKTVEGIEHKTLPIFGVQFHPEHSPGPTDTSFLFDRFLGMVK